MGTDLEQRKHLVGSSYLRKKLLKTGPANASVSALGFVSSPTARVSFLAALGRSMGRGGGGLGRIGPWGLRV